MSRFQKMLIALAVCVLFALSVALAVCSYLGFRGWLGDKPDEDVVTVAQSDW